MPTVPIRNKYADLFAEQDQEQVSRITRAAYLSADTNPDQESNLHKISQKSGIPVEALRLDNGIEAKRRIAAQSVELLPSSAPRTAEWFSNPENANIAHDDLEALSNLERVAREGFGKVGGSTMGIASPNDQKAAKRAKSIGSAFVEGIVASPENINEGLARTGQKAAEFVDWSLAAFPDETGMRKRVTNIFKESADAWKKQGENQAPKKEAGTAEYYVQQAGSSIGTSLMAAPFGMGGLNAASAMFGLFSEGGYQEMRDKGVSVPMAAALSSSNSAMEGLTEKLGLDALYKGSAPVLKKAIGFVMGDLAGEEINTLYNSLVDKVTITPDMTMADVVQRVVDTAIVTAIAGPAQGVSMSGAARVSEGLYSNMLARQQAQSQADFLIALGEGVKATKTHARLPEKVQELIRAAKEDGPVTDVFVPVERFTELFQSQGMDPRQMAEQMLSDPKRYYEAVTTGGDVAIPLEEFATLAGESFYAELVKDAKTSIGGMTAREAEAFGADSERTINDLLAQAAEEEPPVEDQKYQDAYQRIYDDTYGQLIGIGRNPGQAEADATIRAKGLSTLAQRYGYDPASLEQQFPLTITRGNLPSVLQQQPSFTEQQQQAQLFEMLDTIRSGKASSPSEMFGLSLVEFLREKGIKDDRGDLKSMDVDNGIKFKKKLLRKDGISVDKAREAAVEAGYLPASSDINSLLDAVSNELKGQPKYAPGNINEKLTDKKQSLDELAQWLDMMGVDLAQSDNSKIVEMMQQAVGQISSDQSTLDSTSGRGIIASEGGVTYVAENISNYQRNTDGPERSASKGVVGNLDTSGSVREQFSLFFPEGNKPQEITEPASNDHAQKVVTGTMFSGITTIKTAEDAAHIAFPLTKRAQEALIAIVTDSKGKVLGIIQHTTGSLNQSIVQPRDLLGVVHDFPGASQVWFAHNHPTGDPILSQEDRSITKRLASVLDGSAITSRGMIAVGSEGGAVWTDGEGGSTDIIAPQLLKLDRDRNKKIKTYDREIIKLSGNPRMTAPNQVVDYAKTLGDDASGIIIIDGKNRAVSFVPMTVNEMQKLKTLNAYSAESGQ